MSASLQADLLDTIADDAASGFRLERLEIYNWGTFDQHVWKIEPNNANALLTGDIGSGKSTLVDAITTLLVPHHRIIYNKAAGANSKERNLYSYIRGEYKNEKDSFTQIAKAIALRDDNNYTVLLGYFYNAGFSQGVTLAQVFWIKDSKRNPERFFLVAQESLSIAKHFSGFNSDILNLKKQLRRDEKIELFDHFKEYSTRFRQLFGIYNEQALELFYQTVSLKSVGNLTEFVRNHMLEKHDIDHRLNELRHNFDNLNRAHAAVLKAKRQIELLQPLTSDASEYITLGEKIHELCQCWNSLPAYFAIQKVVLLQERIVQLKMEIEKDQQKLLVFKQEIQQLYSQEADTRKNIDNNGGQRLQVIDKEIFRLSQEREQKQKIADQHQLLLKKLNLPPVIKEDDFYSNFQAARAILEKLTETEEATQLKQVDVRIEIKAAEAQQKEITDELASLKKRQNNIPMQMLMLRQQITSALDINENTLPYVGELLQIAESESAWEGAIERVLHHFCLSLLVPEKFYSQVNHYVEKTELKGRLVYYRVKLENSSLTTPQLEAGSLVSKLQIRPESIFSAWLTNELGARFNYICCKDLEEFRHLPQALTLNGLIKSKGQRHEKDDRHHLYDRSRYVLGWSNQQKITALNFKLKTLEQNGHTLVTKLADFVKQQEKIRMERDACRDLLNITHFTTIDWQSLVQQIQAFLEEKQQIEQSSDILKTLKLQLEKIQQLLRTTLDTQTALERKLGGKEQQLADCQHKLIQIEPLAKQSVESVISEVLKKFKDALSKNPAFKTSSLDNIEQCQHETQVLIQQKKDVHENQHKHLTGRITKQMQIYKNNYPAETCETDATPEAIPEYMRMLALLEKEDLPRHEKRFKELLNEGTINSIALFQNQLNREKQDIEDRIRKINLSLHGIEYSTGTYIALLIEPTQDAEIRNFQQDLRRCLQNTLSEQDFYDEDKFLQVKALIERFNGREELVDMDRCWTQKVCDVRNWVTFSASERWLEDNSEKEFYSDSSGKSGGQKEKLAYTILASALAYQFGLEWGVTQSRSFRFVVIDEAFGKGSNDSTRYGLELFKKLNLQLLIVTPLQKIHIIEDYVKAIHFIENKTGCHSVIRNLTIEEYQQEKIRYQEKMHDLASAD